MTGMSVLEYITQCRVSCASGCSRTTDMKTLDIAYESGFNSPARFYPCFKRVGGPVAGPLPAIRARAALFPSVAGCPALCSIATPW